MRDSDTEKLYNSLYHSEYNSLNQVSDDFQGFDSEKDGRVTKRDMRHCGIDVNCHKCRAYRDQQINETPKMVVKYFNKRNFYTAQKKIIS